MVFKFKLLKRTNGITFGVLTDILLRGFTIILFKNLQSLLIPWISKSKCSNKLSVFIWLFSMDRLNTRVILKRKNFKVNNNNYSCVLCDLQTEETDFHLFFACPFSKRCWESIFLHWDHNLPFFDMVRQAKLDFSQLFFMEAFIIAVWQIWKQRNGFIFQNQRPGLSSWKIGFLEESHLQSHRFKDSIRVLLWDWRSSKQLACLEESHMDDVTQVKFAPNQQSKLISAAVDGLVCVFDTDGDIDEDSHLLSVMNAETSVAKVGFFGNMYQKLWCLTHIETLSTWDWNDGTRELSIEDARSLATDRWNLDHLWLIGGTTAGTLGYFPVRNDPVGAIGSAEAILEGGHTGVVRTVFPAASTHQSLGQNRGIFGWTGGEDGRLCCWRSDEIAEINKSWISNSLVSRLQKRTKSRHQPY
ncbi:WD repeat-containing protein GTS1-like isoform X2 [Phragmites australis]|uniref:WD repeat-containing protein GTS1-like isoform X2 n=1 Tax=Phragmites australis TaxID=29695 RepID=UPI002D7925E2|nr:WD repeat-containing protein GTS1-like isoform X2 [Phragmites australis]